VGIEKSWSCSSELVCSGILECCCGGDEIPNGEKFDIDDCTPGGGKAYPLLTLGNADVLSPMVLPKEEDTGGGEKKRGGGGDVA